MTKTREVYISTDVETDGPIPGINSMLSFGSAAYLPDKTLVDKIGFNLQTLPDAKPHPKTMEWWATKPEAWAECRLFPSDPLLAMNEYLKWLKGIHKNWGVPVFVAYPAGFDFMFVNWYLIRFTGETPFGWSALDIKTMAMTMLKTPYRQSTKSSMPKQWFDKELPHTHCALDDAIEQGALFCNMLAELQGG